MRYQTYRAMLCHAISYYRTTLLGLPSRELHHHYTRSLVQPYKASCHLQGGIEQRECPQGGEVGADAVSVVDAGAQLGALRGQDDLQHAVDAVVGVLMVQICTYEGGGGCCRYPMCVMGE